MLERLLERRALRLTLISPLGPRLWPSSLQAVTTWVEMATDAGVEQSDDVTVDASATRAALDAWARARDGVLAREIARLRNGIDMVIGDVPPLAFEAAAACGVPSVAIANFSWDWIYQRLGFDAAAASSALAYAHAGVLLEAQPSAPMPAFGERAQVGMIARRSMVAASRTRRLLGIADDKRVVLLGLRPDSAALVRLPAPRNDVCYLVDAAWPGLEERRDVARLARHMSYPDLVAAADVVVGKPGYGLISDVAAGRARLLYVARPGFPENEVLVEWLTRWNGGARVDRAALAAGTWGGHLDQLLARPQPPAMRTDGAERAAAHIASLLAAR